MLSTITINDYTLYEGDIEPLIIGIVAVIIAYLVIDLIARKKHGKITFYADILAPITVFVLSMIFFVIISRIQDWATLIPFVMAIGFIPVSVLLTVVKLIVVLIKRIKKRDS